MANDPDWLDVKVMRSLEAWLAVPLEPRIDGIRVCNSQARTGEPFNSFIVHKIEGNHNVVISCAPDLSPTFEALSMKLSESELFSEFGIELIRRAVPAKNSSAIGTGFSYFLSAMDDLKGVRHPFTVISQMSADQLCNFTIALDGQTVTTVQTYRRDFSGCVFLDVQTHEQFRGRGLATAAVYEATRWLLRHGFVPRYGAAKSNLASLLIAKRLGFILCSQHIVG